MFIQLFYPFTIYFSSLDLLQYSFLKCDDQKCLQYSRYRCIKVFYKSRIIWAVLGLLLLLCLLASKSCPEGVKYCVGSIVCCGTLA